MSREVSLEEKRINADLDVRNIFKGFEGEDHNDEFIYVRGTRTEGDELDTCVYLLADMEFPERILSALEDCLTNDDNFRNVMFSALSMYLNRFPKVKKQFLNVLEAGERHGI